MVRNRSWEVIAWVLATTLAGACGGESNGDSGGTGEGAGGAAAAAGGSSGGETEGAEGAPTPAPEGAEGAHAPALEGNEGAPASPAGDGGAAADAGDTPAAEGEEGGASEGPDGGPNTSGDAGEGGEGTEADAGVPAEPAPYELGLPNAETFGVRRGYHVARSIIHLHSVYSHDACDGDPRPGGEDNEPCLQDLRKAVCDLHIDYAMLTEHAGHIAEQPDFEAVFTERPGDTWITGTDGRMAKAVNCEDGHQVLFMVGAENELMPVGLREHPADPALEGALNQAYHGEDAAAADVFKNHGAAVCVAHTEQRPDDYLAALGHDAQEIANLHALLAPDLRMEFLGLEAGAAAAEFANFIFNPGAYPDAGDLAFLGFHQEIKVYMEKWDKMLAQRTVAGIGGNDAHQNVLNQKMPDGERPDSYRRMLKWFNNHVLIQEKSPSAILDAVRAARSFVVFEVLGSPDHFDFYAETPAGAVEMGGAAPAGPDTVLRVTAPKPLGIGGSKAPEITVKLMRVTPNGTELAEESAGDIELASPSPGVYRPEVWITPHHYSHLMTKFTRHYIKSMPWIYGNAIRVE